MMKNNRQSFWSIPIIISFALAIHFFSTGRILPDFVIFLVFTTLVGLIVIFWNNQFYSSLEETLYKFSDIHGGTVELIKVTEDSEFVYYDATGNYYGRAFHVNTEWLRLNRGNYQMMNVRLKIDSPIIASLRLKREPWGKVDLDPLTIADIYEIQFTFRQQIPVDSIYDDHFTKLRSEFIDMIDQQKLKVKLPRLGKKYRDYLNRFHISTNEEYIEVKKCRLVRSVDELEDLMSSLNELATLIEGLASGHFNSPDSTKTSLSQVNFDG